MISNERRSSIKETLESQDFQQKANVYITFVFELYRVWMSCMLLFTVPQKCDDHICSSFEHVSSSNPIIITGFTVNIVTLCMFLLMYLVEIQREHKMINYLEVDKTLPRDNESVGKELTKLPTEKHDRILYSDKMYQLSGTIAMVLFIMNAGISGYSVFIHYLNNNTITVYITNVLFMTLKLKDVYDIVNTKQNVFLSSYLTRKIQFNAVDPDKIQELPDIENTPILELNDSEDQEFAIELSSSDKVMDILPSTTA
jgi:hypothetical protein